MAARKKLGGKKRTLASTRVDGGDPTTVVLEDIRSQNKRVIEAVLDLGKTMDRDIRSLREELMERISVLESAVRTNSKDIRQNTEDIRKNSEDIRGLQSEVAGLRDLLARKADAAALSALKHRVSALESKAGIAAPAS